MLWKLFAANFFHYFVLLSIGATKTQYRTWTGSRVRIKWKISPLTLKKSSDSMLERTSELRRMNEQPAENEKKKGKKGGKLIEGFQNLEFSVVENENSAFLAMEVLLILCRCREVVRRGRASKDYKVTRTELERANECRIEFSIFSL